MGTGKPSSGAWIATVITLVGYFALMLAGAVMPRVLSEPITSDSPISWGLVLGVLDIIFLIFVSICYTAWRKDEAN
jgi:uncharacterized membrane protein (DUF485 family)